MNSYRQEDFCKTQEAMAILRCGRTKLSDLKYQHNIPVSRLGYRTVLWHRPTLERIFSQTVTATPEQERRHLDGRRKL